MRGVRSGAMMGAALKDIRYGVRMLRNNPGFAAVAVLSLAIGMGATSAAYSIADALLLRPLPVSKPSGITAATPATDQSFAALNLASYPDYKDLRDRNRTFEGLVADSYSFFGFAADRTTVPRMKFGKFVSGNYFQVLRSRPRLLIHGDRGRIR